MKRNGATKVVYTIRSYAKGKLYGEEHSEVTAIYDAGNSTIDIESKRDKFINYLADKCNFYPGWLEP